MTLTPSERRVVDAVDLDLLLRLLTELVAIPSTGGHESPAQRAVARILRDIGLEVDEWTIDLEGLSGHPSYGAEIERDEAIGVVGTLGRGSGRRLILNGHVDVVPPGDLSRWRHDPWRAVVAEGHVHGRGALDMKGGLCCALAAARALVGAGVALGGRLMVESVVGEEDGGLGTLAAIERGYHGDGAIVMEPTALAVAPAQGGALNFRLHVEGRAAHGAVREEGVSALEKFIVIHEALAALETKRNRRVRSPLLARFRLPHAITLGVVRAGSWASNVPESLVCEGRYGVAIDESPALARRELEEAVADVAREDEWLRIHPPRVEWWGGQFAPAAIDETHPLVTTTCDAFRAATDRDAVVEGVTYGADMRLLVHEGRTPAVLFGPGDIRLAHRPDERVPVSDLAVVARTLALTALRFCG